jgi:hypothetical protein
VNCIYNRTPIYNQEDQIWNKALASLFLKYIPKLYAYPWKKIKNAQIQSLYPQIWGLEIWPGKRFRP